MFIVNLSLFRKGYYSFALIISSLAAVDTGDFQIKHLEISTNVSLINCMSRDRDGFLWIGTHNRGVYKYDGYELKQYSVEEGRADSLSNQLIERMIIDRSGNLWIGTRGGLNRYLKESDSFKRYLPEQNTASFYDGPITSLYIDQEKTLWVVTSGGIMRYDAKNDDFEAILGKADLPFQMDFGGIAQDQKGDYWIVGSGSELIKYSLKNESFETFWCTELIDSQTWDLKSIFIDSRDQIWIYGDRANLIKFEKATSRFKRFNVSADGSGTNGAQIADVVEYPKGQLLLAVNDGGLNRMNLDDFSFSYQDHNSPYGFSISGGGIRSLHVDNENILWLGAGRRGIDYHNPKENRFQIFPHMRGINNTIAGEVASTFYESYDGKLWIGLDGQGISILDRKQKTFEHINADGPSARIPSNVVRKIQRDSDGKIWVATWDKGISILENKDKKIVRVREMDDKLEPFRDRRLWSMYIDKKDRIWTTAPNGYVTGHHKDLSLFFEQEYNSFVADYTPIVEEWEGIGIIFSFDETLSVYNEALNKFELKFKTPGGVTIEYDGKDRFYSGTLENGVFVYDSSGKIITHLTKKEGLSDNSIAAIELDTSGKVWFSTGNGLDVYDPEDKSIVSYTDKDGLAAFQFFPESSIRLKSGEIGFGGNSGLTLFNPNSIRENNHLAVVHIKNILLKNEPVDFRKEDAIFSSQPDRVDELNLEWNQNFIGFEITPLSLTFPHNNKYAFRLEGLEDSWNYREANSRFISYANLAPGKYVLHLKASNNDGVWNEDIRSIQINIAYPFWRTPWFYAIVALVIVYLLIWIIKHREKAHIRDKLLLEAKVAERTKQIEDQNHELERQGEELLKHQTKLEDIVDERTRELVKARNLAEKSDQLKSHFLANVSHEIRTPLNAIIGLSSFLGEKELPDSDRNEYTHVIEENSHSLLKLIEDILDFSMMETEQLTIENESIDLNRLLREIHSSFSDEPITQRVSLLLDNELSKQNLVLRSDHKRLKQILDNLITNALKFTKKGKVVIGAKQVEGQIALYVEDNGPGIPESMQKAVFQEFTKLEKDQIEAMRGVGLGLAISNRLSSLLGGNLHMKSTLGEGTTFTLLLPISICDGKEKPNEEIQEEIIKPLSLTGKIFLVIEDEYSNYLYLREILERRGASVEYADGGQNGLDRLKEQTYDLVFLDIQMPGMNGYETLHEIRKVHPDMKVVSQTAFSFPEDIRKIREAAFDGNLWKPISSDSIDKVLSDMFD